VLKEVECDAVFGQIFLSDIFTSSGMYNFTAGGSFILAV